MPKVTFYIHVARPDEFVCRLAARAVRDGRVLVWTDSAEQAAQIDRDLWQREPQSFLPHEIWDIRTPMPSETPLLIACDSVLPHIPTDMAVLNLSPDFWSAAEPPPERVLEIVGTNLEALAEARERFKAYRQNGFSIEHHSMAGKA